jgi:hypothetical protein
MIKRKLIFHFGGPKTGSSALQNYLNDNCEKLKEDDFYYLNSNFAKGEINSGNGFYLFSLLNSESYNFDSLDCMIDSYLAESPNAISICSSELFSFLEKKEIINLINSCIRLNIEYKIIYFVRAPFGYCISNYNQLAKRHGETRSLEQFMITAKWEHFVSLQKLHEILPPNNLLVLNYNDAKRNIVKYFFDAINFAPKHYIYSDEKLINRSFSNQELDLMLTLNRILGSSYSMTISDIILKHNSSVSIQSSLCISKQFAEVIFSKFENELLWINSTFFSQTNSCIEENINSFVFSGSVICESKKVNVTAEKELLIWAASELVNVENSILIKIKDRILSLIQDTTLANDPNIPSDFNPVLYLIINNDLIINNVNPYFHFINYASKEGRQYKI